MSDSLPYPPYGPKSLGQILDRVVRLLRANIKLFLGIACVPGAGFFAIFASLAGVVASAVIPHLRDTNQDWVVHVVVLSFCAFIGTSIAHATVLAIYLPAAFYAAVCADSGAKVTFRESYATAQMRIGRYVFLFLTLYAICLLPALVSQLLTFGAFAWTVSSKIIPGPFAIILLPIGSLLYAAFLIGGALLALRLCLAFPASLFEDLKVKAAIQRSWSLTRGALGRVSLALLAVYAATYVALLVVIYACMSVVGIGFLISSAIHEHFSAQIIWIFAVLAGIAFLAVMGLFTAASWAGYTTALAVIYNDQRMRIDGAASTIAPNGVPA